MINLMTSDGFVTLTMQTDQNVGARLKVLCFETMAIVNVARDLLPAKH